ncbi:hypothetical protein C8R47DRAFT_1093198 [Mycena vitilis]|nr:hypothetical protein C8R47DRAFT_1093198 [Mycena vitilis]
MLLPQMMPAPDAAVDTLNETAKELCRGAKRYHIKKEQVDRANHVELRKIASTLSLTLVQLATSPTLARTINTFSRDLELLDIDVWTQMEDVVKGELQERIPVKGARLPCPFCPVLGSRSRVYFEGTLQMHIRSAHPQQAPEPISIPGEYRCTLCPTSRLVYTRASLLRHADRKHDA